MSVTSPPTIESRTTAAARSRETTRRRLVQSGQALFAESGLHKVTSHDIAAHAGVASGTFYNHFQDKHALFRELAHSAMRELTERLDRATSPSGSLEARVRAHATAMIEFAEENRDVIRMLFSGDADAAQVESDLLNELAAGIADVRRRSIAAGEMPSEIDPTVLSHAMVGMWARVIAWWAEDPTRATRNTVSVALTRIQLSGTHPNLSDCAG